MGHGGVVRSEPLAYESILAGFPELDSPWAPFTRSANTSIPGPASTTNSSPGL